MRKIAIGILAVFIAVSVTGCSLLGGNKPAPPGSLDLTVAPLLPGVDTVTARLSAGSSVVTKELTVDKENNVAWALIDGLQAGTWMVQVEAKDAEGKTVSSAIESVKIQADTVATLGIVLTEPVWGIIAYVFEGNIYLMRDDGAEVTQLTAGLAAENPALSPDGTQVLFEADRDIYVVSVRGGEPVKLTNDTSRNRSACWSPDGQKIAFESNRDGVGDIFIMNADGTDPVNITGKQAQSIQPTWSPDGTTIAFSSSRGDGKTQNLYVMNADGSAPRVLREGPTAMYQAAYSPDGRQIAFMEGGAIRVIDANSGGNLTILTNSATHGSCQRPAWSPDGTKIAFHGSKSGVADIYTMNLDGSDLQQLTQNGGSKLPTWSVDGR